MVPRPIFDQAILRGCQPKKAVGLILVVFFDRELTVRVELALLGSIRREVL
jgi:hypothetical protein